MQAPGCNGSAALRIRQVDVDNMHDEKGLRKVRDFYAVARLSFRRIPASEGTS